MENAVDILNALFRWLHIFAGIVWIGMLYFFNWVNGPFVGTMDGETKKKVVPELMPRALFWFRWGAAWTWLTGVLLLLLVFYHGGLMFEPGWGWGRRALVMVAATFLAAFVYDAIQKSPLGKDPKLFGGAAFLLIAAFLFAGARSGLSYRALNIHLGAMFGTIMAFNVWFRIWPAQQTIIKGVKGDGPAADPGLVAMAGTRSRHNVYMSVPLLWAMINNHTTWFSGNEYISRDNSFVVPLVVILLGWHIVWHLYKKAPTVKGF